MMSPRRLSMVVILAVVMRQLVPVPAQAQLAAPASELTIEELVARALADNPDLRATRAEVDAAGGRLRQAGLRPNPELDLGGQKALSPDNNLTVTLRLPLDLNDRRGGRVAVAKQDLELKRKQLADRERRLRTDVRMKAGEMLAARRNLQITDELLDVDHSALRVVGNRVREGAAPTIDENLQLVEVNRLDANRQLLSSRVEIATLQLKLLAGMAADAPLTVRGELTTSPPTLERAEAVQRALASPADLAAARAEVAVPRATIRKEQAEARSGAPEPRRRPAIIRAWPWVTARRRRGAAAIHRCGNRVHGRVETGVRRGGGSRARRRRERTVMQEDEVEPMEPGRFASRPRDRRPGRRLLKQVVTGLLLIALGIAAGVVWSERRTSSAEKKSPSGTTKSMPGM